MNTYGPTAAARTSVFVWLFAACSDSPAQPMQPVMTAPVSGTTGAPPPTAGTAMPAAGGGGMTATGVAGTMSPTAPSAGAGAGATSGSGGMSSSQAGMSGAGMSGAPSTGGSSGAPPADAGTMMMDAEMPMDAAMPTGTTCLKGSGDYTGKGPYNVKSKNVSVGSKGMYTIFYPDPLDTDCPHPIVAWGNGTTITGGTAYDHFHNHAGSWGIVTIASHNSNVGDGTFHRAGIDYLLMENGKMGSEFFGKLSMNAGVTGHSQGGAGGDRSSDHANVKANVNVQGSFGNPPPGKAPLLCLTGTDDIQPTGCPRAVMAATMPAVAASWDGADHVSTTLFEGEGIEQYQRLYTAWFRCFLADDGKACELFKGGAECPVCKEDGWDEIFAKNY